MSLEVTPIPAGWVVASANDPAGDPAAVARLRSSPHLAPFEEVTEEE